MRTWFLFLLLIALVALLAGCPARQAPPAGTAPPGPTPATIAGEVQAYIPCGMVIPMHAVIQAFEAKNPSVKVKSTYDNAGIIVKRLAEKGETADVVVSPGRTEMAALATAGLVDAAAQQTIGTFELVCIVPAASTQTITKPEDLKQCKTVALPNPDVNSTGASGKEALTKLGLWETLKPRMIQPNHAIEAHTMVASGKAQAGIAYKNCPLETNPEKLSKSKVRVAFSFPADSYEKQPCLVAVTTKAPNRAAAQALVDFIVSAEGRKILGENGMTGCLDLAPAAAQTDGAAPAAEAGKPAVKADITVVAFYPGNEKHKPIRDLVMGLPQKFGPRVSAEFVDFTSDEGFKRWHDEKGLTCGAILINDQQTWTYEQNGKVKEVTFKMAEGGEWTKEDLYGVVQKLLKEKQ